MSKLEQLQTELQTIQQKITALEMLRETLSQEQYEIALNALREKEAQLTVLLTDSGGIAQGDHNTALGRDAVLATDISGVVIKGDNNTVNTIIQKVGEGLPPEKLREEIGRYLSWVIAENSTITLRGIQHDGRNVIDLRLDKVFVPLAAQVAPEQRPYNIDPRREEMMAEREKRIELSDVLAQGQRLIITGGPGCGKTTVLMFIAWTLAEAIGRDDPALVAQKLNLTDTLPLPILIPLNRYAAYLRDLPNSATAEQHTLAAFISHHLIKRQSSLSLPADFFRQLLRQKKQVMLLLDGLDEVANESQRGQVTQAIEDLVKGYPDLPVVVTCRTAAYRGNALLGHRFREIKVQPLEQEHITALITQAYQAVYPYDVQKSAEQSRELLEGIAQIEAERRRRLGDGAERLVTSPLLVRMLLLVHLSDRRLPEQRAELYQKATQNLLQAHYGRDRYVGEALAQRVGGPLKHLELVQYVAFHMHKQGTEQGREIDEFDLRRELAQREEFASYLADFLAITCERGTVMEERGQLYRFIHLGFQEFLVARHMAEVLLFEQTLFSFLAAENRLTDSWWREPILLLVGYLSLTNTKRAETVVRYLAGIDGRPLTNISQAEQWAGAELAATAVLEWPTAADALKEAVTQRLADLVTVADTSAVPVQLRANLGMALGHLGDPRPGVGIREDGLPDIVWGEVVPAGTYTIGSKQDADNPVRAIEIKQSYQLAIYPITAAQFQCFVEADDIQNARWWAGMPQKDRYGAVQEVGQQSYDYDNHPRETVTWYQATAFCRWLSAKTGEQICLPHEHQWEVAARFKDGGIYPWGDEFDSEKANTYHNDLGQTTAVGLYPQGKNPSLNLYDMSGNIFEWCCNKYGNPDETEVDDTNDRRGLRGGSFFSDRVDARAASRFDLDPGLRADLIGFRVCVLCPPSY